VVIPIVIVPKKIGKLWICVDYIWLHSPTKKDFFPLSLIDEALNIVASKDIYAFLDGFSGYNQIKIHLDD
jgi:hypothetical protein